jgi:hypothetical protein
MNLGVLSLTMPSERFYAIRNTREFLVELMDPKKTPGIPKTIRLKAYYAIKHFPGEYYMEQARELAPEIFGESPNTKPVDSSPYEHNRGRS